MMLRSAFSLTVLGLLCGAAQAQPYPPRYYPPADVQAYPPYRAPARFAEGPRRTVMAGSVIERSPGGLHNTVAVLGPDGSVLGSYRKRHLFGYRSREAELLTPGLLARGFPVHLVDHLASMADLHRAGRYDRMSDDVLTLTGQAPLSVQDFVRKNAATFTASARAA